MSRHSRQRQEANKRLILIYKKASKTILKPTRGNREIDYICSIRFMKRNADGISLSGRNVVGEEEGIHRKKHGRQKSKYKAGFLIRHWSDISVNTNYSWWRGETIPEMAREIAMSLHIWNYFGERKKRRTIINLIKRRIQVFIIMHVSTTESGVGREGSMRHIIQRKLVHVPASPTFEAWEYTEKEMGWPVSLALAWRLYRLVLRISARRKNKSPYA